MTDPSLADDLSFALALAASADLVSIDRYRALDLEVRIKDDDSPVTDADTAVESVLRASIEASRPGDAILGEEFGGDADAAPHRQWIIDPIDGTANFLRGIPIWGTLIALAVDRVPVVGVVSAPALARRWWAARGRGAWTAEARRAPRRLAVSDVDDLSRASVSYNSLHGWAGAGRLDDAVRLARASARDRAIGDMWSYMLLAEGALDVVAELDLRPYDVAAIIPVVEEAGGRFTSVEGEDGPWHGSALATNGALHAPVLDLLAGREDGDAPLPGRYSTESSSSRPA